MSSQMNMAKFCTHCAKKGETRKLKPYLINFDEAVLLCVNEECNILQSEEGFLIVNIQQIAFKPKGKRKKLKDNVIVKQSVNTVEPKNQIDLVEKTVDKELDDILSGLTLVGENATLDSEDLSFFGFGDDQLPKSTIQPAENIPSDSVKLFDYDSIEPPITYCQPVEKTPEECSKSKNIEVLDFENAKLSGNTTEPVEKHLASNNAIHEETLKSGDADPLRPNDVQLPKQLINPVEKSTNECCFKYPFWRNEKNLCWLHAIMCVIVHNNGIRNYVFGSMRESFLNKLILGFDECVALLNSEGTNPELISETLRSLRDQLFTLLKPKMKQKLGDLDNPWFVLWALVSMDKTLSSLFDFKHRWETICEKCGFKKVERKRKTLQTFTNVSGSFSLPDRASMYVSCSKCGKEMQSRYLKFVEFPSVLALQFEQGLSLQNIASYDFTTKDATYKVSAIIQYKKCPNHFVTWIRDTSSEKLLRCDDLNSDPVSFEKGSFEVEGSEVHVMFWDKTQPNIRNEDKVRQCSDSLTSSMPSEDIINASSIIKDSRFEENLFVKNWDCNSSLYSDHSNSTAPFESRATTPDSLIDSLITKPSQKRNAQKRRPKKTNTGTDSDNTNTTNTRKRPRPATSSVSDISNPSDGDLSIVSVLKNSKYPGYDGYKPKKISSISKEVTSTNRKRKRPNVAAGTKKPDNSMAKNVENSHSNLPSMHNRELVKESISNLLNDTDIFAI